MLFLKNTIPFSIFLQAGGGETTLFARAIILNNDASTVLATISLPHVAAGRYVGSYTPSASGYQHVVGQFFTDAGFTTPSDSYDIVEDDIRVLDIDEQDTYALVGTLNSNINNTLIAATAAQAAAVAAQAAAASGLTILTLLQKLQTDRWKFVGTQLVYYEMDGVTPLLTFNCKDGTGAPSITQIFERVPV